MAIFGFFSTLKEKINAWFTKLSTDANYRNMLLRSFGLLLFIGICAVILYFASMNPKALGSDALTYALYIVVPLIFLVAIFSTTILRESNSLQYGLLFALSLGFIAVVAYSYIKFTSQSIGAINTILTGLVILGLIFGLGLFFLAVGNVLKQQKGWIGFIVNIIFYVPCLVVDYIKYLTHEFKSTVNYVYILYGVEIAIIFAYIYLPKLINYIFLQDGDTILSGPVFLDIHESIPLGPLMVQDRIDATRTNDIASQNQPVIYRSSFGLSFWVYVNTQSSIDLTKEIPILNFGSGKPKVTYVYDNTNSMKPYCFKVYFTNNRNTDTPGVYQFNLPAQKWCFIAFNYPANVADLFVNGKLEYSFAFNQSNMPIFSGKETLEVGSDNGVNGAICNIKYYKQNLTRAEVANAYNLLMYSNPPTQEVATKA